MNECWQCLGPLKYRERECEWWCNGCQRLTTDQEVAARRLDAQRPPTYPPKTWFEQGPFSALEVVRPDLFRA